MNADCLFDDVKHEPLFSLTQDFQVDRRTLYRFYGELFHQDITVYLTFLP